MTGDHSPQLQPVRVRRFEVEQVERVERVEQVKLRLVHEPQGIQGPADPAHGVAALGEGRAGGVGHTVGVLDR
ncbi:hypothetical protein ACFYYN_39985 [Streptomyces sp. NPDC001902]